MSELRKNYFCAYVMDSTSNRCIATAQFTQVTSRWPWVQQVVAAEYECQPDEIGCIETDRGDKITAQGRVVAYLAD